MATKESVIKAFERAAKELSDYLESKNREKSSLVYNYQKTGIDEEINTTKKETTRLIKEAYALGPSGQTCPSCGGSGRIQKGLSKLDQEFSCINNRMTFKDLEIREKILAAFSAPAAYMRSVNGIARDTSLPLVVVENFIRKHPELFEKSPIAPPTGSANYKYLG